MAKLFISHSTDDDAIVRALQQALGELEQDVWIDSRELRGGDALWPKVAVAERDELTQAPGDVGLCDNDDSAEAGRVGEPTAQRRHLASADGLR